MGAVIRKDQNGRVPLGLTYLDLHIARARAEMATGKGLYLLLLVLLVLCLSGNGVYAFGAGNIPRCVID